MTASHLFEHNLRVTASDCTVGNHVYYARYLEWFDAARGELLRKIGYPLSNLIESGLMLPVIEARIEYLAPARFDDQITVRLWIAELSRIRVTFSTEIVNSVTGKPLVRASSIHVCTDTADKPKRFPDPMAAALLSVKAER